MRTAYRYRRKRQWWQRQEVTQLVALAAIAAVFSGVFMAQSTWPWHVSARHLLTSFDCSMARTVGFAPAYRGQPGYHEDNDADGDGIACEPTPRRY